MLGVFSEGIDSDGASGIGAADSATTAFSDGIVSAGVSGEGADTGSAAGAGAVVLFQVSVGRLAGVAPACDGSISDTLGSSAGLE